MILSNVPSLLVVVGTPAVGGADLLDWSAHDLVLQVLVILGADRACLVLTLREVCLDDGEGELLTVDFAGLVDLSSRLATSVGNCCRPFRYFLLFIL